MGHKEVDADEFISLVRAYCEKHDEITWHVVATRGGLICLDCLEEQLEDSIKLEETFHDFKDMLH